MNVALLLWSDMRTFYESEISVLGYVGGHFFALFILGNGPL